ncbi:MAG TPA: hypothetical protein VMT68_02770 [Caulobacteraceae bacterium]|nr:hypothetical protein [Caulobacteraceae bacterium]
MKGWIWLTAAATLGWAGAAYADPRLDEVVYSPYVENHVLEVETRWGQEFGPGDLQGARTEVVELEAGLNDRASLALVTAVQREPGESDRLTAIGLEGIYYLGQIPKVGVDTAAYLEIAKGFGGESDGLEAKLLFAKTSGRFQGLFNFIVERPLGAPAGEGFASYGYAASATWRTVGKLRLGVEAFGDLGDDHGFLSQPQGAYVGPQLKWEGRLPHMPAELEVDAGWLAAVGPDRHEAASQVRLNLEFEHRF